MNNIIEAAVNTGCDAIHPGFGFLSENSSFAGMCRENGIKFIGPDADVIDQMGNKAAARRLMRAAGVPVVPGSEGAVKGPEEAAVIADEIRYPVLLKASAGGGGRGMKLTAEDLRELGICDSVIPEPAGGAHKEPDHVFKAVDEAISEHLSQLLKLGPAEIVKKRYRKLRNAGNINGRN